VIGGGNIGEDKVRRLVECGADVTVISPEVSKGVRELAQAGEVSWLQREYAPGDLEGVFIAIAATDDNRVNRRVVIEAEKRDILLNVVDAPDLCTFFVPSVVRRGEVTIATSTGGASPALARAFREKLEGSRILEYADLAPLLAQARAELKKLRVIVLPDHWQDCITEELLGLVQSGRKEEAKRTLIAGLLEGATSVPDEDLS
jgi:siroheme synthase-like protein